MGDSLRVQLESVANQTGIVPKELDTPLPPDRVMYLWLWFQQLSRRRGSGFGPSPLTFSEVAAWAMLTGYIVSPAEVEVLMLLDDLYLTAEARRQAIKQRKPAKSNKNAGGF